MNNVFTVQSTGTIELDGGSVDGTNLINNNGLIKGSGTLNVSVNNNGRIAPGGDGATGVLSHLASFSQTGDGVLDIELADASNYDQVTVDGGATLAGTLNVTFLAPSLGTSWTPLTFGSHTGEMPALLPTAPKVVYASYTSTELDLTAVLVNDLSVAMAGPPGSVVAGSAISYTVDVSNLGPGPDPTRGTTTVIDSLPSGITGASASGSGWNCGAPSSGLITCTSTAAVANGDAFPTLTVSMTAPINGGSVTNLAVVSSSDDNNNANDFGSATTTVAAQSDLAITVNGPAVGILGRSNTYTFTVTNNGPSPATGTTVGSTASSGLSFLSNSGDCATAFPCSLGALYPGQSMTIVAEYVVIDPPPDATATLAGSVASGVADPNTANNSSSVNTLADGIFIDGFERSLE
ncbi:MAG TPA: hypothetical protein VFB32_10345 [Rudaea sp.]|nr:hypothetical protein [Rudaea sp.]